MRCPVRSRRASRRLGALPDAPVLYTRQDGVQIESYLSAFSDRQESGMISSISQGPIAELSVLATITAVGVQWASWGLDVLASQSHYLCASSCTCFKERYTLQIKRVQA